MERATDSPRLQRCINDLVSVLALPAMWTGQDAPRVVGTLLEALVSILHLDFAGGWLQLEGTSPHFEVVRIGEIPPAADAERRIADALDRWCAGDADRWPSRMPNPVGGGDVAIVPHRLGLRQEGGVIVVASTRDGFPSDTERLLLSVAANQAAIAFHEARLLSEQKRIAKELDERVAARTREIAAANEELRRITDAIPHAIIVLARDGSTVYVNAYVLTYTGLSLEDARSQGARDRIFHPEDLERAGYERQLGLSRGMPFESELRARRKDGQYRWFLVRYNPFRDTAGAILHWYATATDIEDRRRAEERVHNESLALRDEIDRSSMSEEIVGSSEELRAVTAKVARVAPTDSTVLIMGETGTGKELVARAIHKRSKRASRAFIRVNCAAIPPALVASELFGHEKGAFTGALQRRIGRFEAADGGTIFLDEVGDLSVDMQVTLLRVLQEREFERVGSSRPIPLDVRVLAATHRDLATAVRAGSFREDLFYRLNVFPIEIPPLRARGDDIHLLVHYMVGRYAKRVGKRIHSIDRNTLALFREYSWPGNVRELQNVVERAMILCDGDTFVVDDSWLRKDANQGSAPIGSLPGTLAANERQIIEAALVATKGRVSGQAGAAARLHIPRQTLESKIRALRIDMYRFKGP